MRIPTLLTATLLSLAHLTLATPPGCLLGAINTYTNPADVKAVCQAKDLSSTVLQFCGSDASAAMQALKDICGDAGVDVSTKLPSSTASASAKPSGTNESSPSGSGSAHSTGSVNPTATGASASGNAAASGSTTAGLPQSTGAAGRMEVGSVLAVVAGVLALGL